MGDDMAQVLGFIYAFILLLSNFGKTKTQILFLQTISFFFKSIHYLLLGGFSGFLISLVSMIRNIIFLKIEKTILWLITFIFLYLLMGIYSYENIFSVLPVLATIIYTLTVNKNNLLYLRTGLIITSIVWLIYNIYINSYSGIIVQIITLVSNMILVKKL